MLFVKGFLCLLVSLGESMHESANMSGVLHASVCHHVILCLSWSQHTAWRDICNLSLFVSCCHFTHLHPPRAQSLSDFIMEIMQCFRFTVNVTEQELCLFIFLKHPETQRSRGLPFPLCDVLITLFSNCFTLCHVSASWFTHIFNLRKLTPT